MTDVIKIQTDSFFTDVENDNTGPAVDSKAETKKENKVVENALKETAKKLEEDDEDDVKVKRTLVRTIHNYIKNERLGKYLADQGFAQYSLNKLKSMRIKQLEALLEEISESLCYKGNTNMIESGFLQSVHVLEKLLMRSEKLKKTFDITGLSNSWRSDDHLLDLLSIIQLKHQSFLAVRPEVQLLYKIGFDSAKQSVMNKHLSQISTIPSEARTLNPGLDRVSLQTRKGDSPALAGPEMDDDSDTDLEQGSISRQETNELILNQDV